MSYEENRRGRLRALFFLNSFAGGGAERVCLSLAIQLHKLGIESDFVTIYDALPDYDIPDHIRIFSIGISTKASSLTVLIDLLKAVPRVDTFISGKKYILITAHLQPSYLLAVLTIKGKHTLYVMHNRWGQDAGWKERLSTEVLKKVLKRKQIVTVSHGLEEELIDKYRMRPQNITTIYNPCSDVELQSEQWSSLPHPRPYILVMGRLVEQKNPLRALALYRDGRFYEHYDLVYIGRGPLEKRLKNEIAKSKLVNYVFLPGFQRNTRQWISNASLLLSCSKYEGFSLNLVEALLCKTPVVSSDCPYGPREILTDELAAYLIDPENDSDPAESISVISAALRSYPEITEKYYAKFDDARIVRRYLDVWHKKFGDESNSGREEGL